MNYEAMWEFLGRELVRWIELGHTNITEGEWTLSNNTIRAYADLAEREEEPALPFVHAEIRTGMACVGRNQTFTVAEDVELIDGTFRSTTVQTCVF